jgi:ATP-binding cassette, subfamily B, multidrug efflux pump
MRKLIKQLRPFVWWIVAIFILLFAQAMSDLALPGYMSDIVNVGIQQNGIESAVPEVVRTSEMDKVTLLMSDDEKAVVKGSYSLIEKQALSPEEYASDLEKYPLLNSVSIYKLNNQDKEKLAQLNILFSRYIPVVATLAQGGQTGTGGDLLPVPAGTDTFVFLSGLPAAQLETIRNTIQEKLAAVSDSMLKQYAVAYITEEYKTIGVNLGSIQTAYMVRIGMFMLLLTLASVACSIVVGYLSARIAAGLGRNLRRQIFQKVENFSNTELDKFSTASLITRTTNDITQIQMLMVMMFRFVFYAPIIGVGGVIKVLGADRSMLWIIGVAVAILLTLMVVLFIVALPKFRSMQTLVDKLNLVTREILTGLMVIRAFNTQKQEEKKFDKANMDLTRVGLFVNRVMVFMMPMMMLIMNGVMLLIVWVGAHQVDLGTMQVGDMMAFMQYAMQIIMAFLMISMMFIMLPRASISAERVSEVLETEPVIKDPAVPHVFPQGKAGLIEFQDVSFRYPGAEEDVLKHISFTARPGQTTAFIGSTGSGKSTLVNLILRFYDVTDGSVKVDGLDVRQVAQNGLRSKIGYVPQQSVLFSGTIESNIRYGNESASSEDIKHFAETAQVMDFISASEKGFATVVAQGGTNFSGGQKQRLSIARAMARKPEIYIFDDSFSALDFRTDAALRRALKQDTRESTVLIVTQRVGTVMNADQIVVLDNGLIAGTGTHKELMQSSKVYREIALSQLSKEELGL